MPSAATSPGPAPASASAPAITRSADSAIASGSCSTSPGPGNAEATATDAEPRSRRSPSSTTQRVLDVPWSSPRTSSVTAVPRRRGARRAPPGTRRVPVRRPAPPRRRAARRRARARRPPRRGRGRCVQPSAPAISAAAGSAAASPRSGAVRAMRVRRSRTSSRCSAPSCVQACTTSAHRRSPPPASGRASAGCASISRDELLDAVSIAAHQRIDGRGLHSGAGGERLAARVRAREAGRAQERDVAGHARRGRQPARAAASTRSAAITR